MKQYFIGINKRSEKVISGLFDLGATLMFYYHPKTIELNQQVGFYDGEWMLYTDVSPNSGIKEIETFMETERQKDTDMKYTIISC